MFASNKRPRKTFAYLKSFMVVRHKRKTPIDDIQNSSLPAGSSGRTACVIYINAWRRMKMHARKMDFHGFPSIRGPCSALLTVLAGLALPMVHGSIAPRRAVRRQRDPARHAECGLHAAYPWALAQLKCHVGRDAAGPGAGLTGLWVWVYQRRCSYMWFSACFSAGSSQKAVSSSSLGQTWVLREAKRPALSHAKDSN